VAGGLRLVTGLLVRPPAGTWLRLTNAANRRNTLLDVEEQLIADDGAWIPLVLRIAIRRGAPAHFRLEGELACLGALHPGVRIRSEAIAEAPELARAHADFYDRAYFEDKRDDVTGKYRHTVAADTASEPAAETEAATIAECRVASIGPGRAEVVPLDGFTTAAGPQLVRRRAPDRGIDTVVFRNELDFAALFDGQSVALEYDAAALAARAQGIEAAFRGVLAGHPALEHRGSELYLTKYFTPHVPGEPHFFVKPAALLATPPGWSCLLDGIHGPAYDILRGIVATDSFHATPAVFRVHREGERLRVPAGLPLLRMIPIPRSLLEHPVRLHRLS
jgi:hypothetical protein